MAFAVVPFQDLPISNVMEFGDRVTRERQILGPDKKNPDWKKFKRVHLLFDADNQEAKSGFKLIIAREEGDRLMVIFEQLVAAVAAINGARGGLADIPEDVRRSAFNHAMRYYMKLDIPKEARPTFVTASRPPGNVALAVDVQLIGLDELGAADDDAQWVQVATEGNFAGYRNGQQPFAFTRAHFVDMVKNVRTHPSFSADDAGAGTVDVIPWDFNHASEMDPTAGSLASRGAPAQAWTRDLQIREGEGGKAELWALTRFLDLARGYVKAGQYKWASVAVTFDATHPVTAENVGALITSIALTNTPFIEGMEQLAASRRKGGDPDVKAFRRFFDTAETPQDAVDSFKELLGLGATAGIAEIMVEVGKMRGFVQSGEAPLGVNMADLVGSMRMILGLPALSLDSEVLDNADQMVARLLDEQADVVPQPTTTATRRNRDMELLKALTSKLGVRESDDAVLAAVIELVELRDSLVKNLSLSRDTASVILEAATDNASARTKLGALLKALEVEDPEAAIDRIANLIKQGVELTEAMPELASLRETAKEQEEVSQEADVAAAMTGHDLPESVKDALLLFRKGDPEKFATQYPKVEKPATGDKQHLLSTIVAGPDGEQKPAKTTTTKVDPNAPDKINLIAWHGQNAIQKAMSYLSATEKGFDSLPYDTRFDRGVEFSKQSHVICEAPAAAG